MDKLVLLRVVRGVTPLDHVSIGNSTATDVWRDICCGDPQSVAAVHFVLPDHPRISLRRLVNYSRRGGVSNAELKRWIIANHLDAPGTDLVFEVQYDEEGHVVIYRYLGKLDR
jgi:hypothetical protein